MITPARVVGVSWWRSVVAWWRCRTIRRHLARRAVITGRLIDLVERHGGEIPPRTESLSERMAPCRKPMPRSMPGDPERRSG